MKEIAIIGATASGKSVTAIEVAVEFESVILSLDSLSIYKEIDIASAKPTKKELDLIKHFGIDIICVDSNFNVGLFFDIYKEAKEFAKANNKNLIIVGGSSFYLKSMIDGISKRVNPTDLVLEKVHNILLDLDLAYKKLLEIDFKYANSISKNDKYRIGKGLEIYFSSMQTPTQFFMEHKREQIIKDITIFEIEIDRNILRNRVYQRTENMLKNGLIDEISYLEKKYTRVPNPMKAIGIREVLDYFDGRVKISELKDKISQNTMALAKRQTTFNRTQFNTIKAPKESLKDIISSYLA